MKCDETRPVCLNCQRQGETCDYSIRLNWEGRGKKKATEPDAPGQISFSIGATSTAALASPGSLESPGIGATSQMHFQGLLFGAKQDEGTPESRSQPRHDLRSDIKYASQPRKTSMSLSSPPQPYNTSIIDPALMLSLEPSAGIYSDSIYGGLHGRPEPQYTQSYERYHSSSTPSTATSLPQLEESMDQRNRTLEGRNSISESSSRNDGNGALMTGGSPQPGQPFFEQVGSNGDAQQQETVGFDRPHKRPRYPTTHDSNSMSPYNPTMPPPNITSYPGYGVDSQPPSALQFDSSSTGTPATPASSLGDDFSKDGYKSFPSKLSTNVVQVTSDVRRLSVNSLLSGPPGISNQGDRAYDNEHHEIHGWTHNSPQNFDDSTVYGIDRGFKDLDIGKNDDANAITGVSPIIIRDHLNRSLDYELESIPMEFGFGMKENPAFETGAYYDKPVHVSIPRALEPLPSRLLENPMNLLVSVNTLSSRAPTNSLAVFCKICEFGLKSGC